MVVDTSILLTIFLNQEHAAWATQQLTRHSSELRMSTVNLAETLIILNDRQPHLFASLREQILSSSIRFVAPDATQAVIAASARLTYPLNLGDCFAYALAKQEGCTLLTLDTDFRSVDLTVLLP